MGAEQQNIEDFGYQVSYISGTLLPNKNAEIQSKQQEVTALRAQNENFRITSLEPARQKLDSATNSVRSKEATVAQRQNEVNNARSLHQQISAAVNGHSGAEMQNLRMVELAIAGAGLTADQRNALFTETLSSDKLPLGKLNELAGDNPVLERNLKQFSNFSGQTLSVKQLINIRDVGGLDHPIDLRSVNQDFTVNEDLHDQIKQALFAQAMEMTREEQFREIEEEVAIVLQMMMARWAGDTDRVDDLKGQLHIRNAI